MSLYAIGDTHLSYGVNKPMDIFGGGWTDYLSKLNDGFSVLKAEDVCVICGDVSWGMTLEEALPDFAYLDSLPGKKILLKGNHDYWWSSAKKMRDFLEKNHLTTISFLHNNCFVYSPEISLCGTKGWFYEEGKGSVHDKKLIDRECLRLEASLKAAGGAEKLVFLHYPPVYGNYSCPEILSLLKQYDVRLCCSGHLHAESLRLAFYGKIGNTEFKCLSADAISFKPCKIL